MSLRIQALRKARGWSQAELARQSGLNVTTVNQIETGRFAGYPVQLAKLAAALGYEGDPEELKADTA